MVITSIFLSAANAARAQTLQSAAHEFRRYAERTRDRGGLGGGEYTTLSTSGSLPGSPIRSVTGWISATLAGSGACKVVDTQSAISGQSAQPTGADLSGQHGMSSDIAAMSSAVEAEPMFARAARGANTRLAIKKTASSRQRWIERVTGMIVAQSGPRWEVRFHHEAAGFVNIVAPGCTALRRITSVRGTS
jgi:hypothetical protein